MLLQGAVTAACKQSIVYAFVDHRSCFLPQGSLRSRQEPVIGNMGEECFKCQWNILSIIAS